METNRDIKKELDLQLKSCEDEFMAHACLIRVLDKVGYEEGHELIEGSFQEKDNLFIDKTRERIKERLTNHERFEKYKESLKTVIASDNWEVNLMQWIEDTYNKGASKTEIYDILIELSLYIQYNPETMGKDSLHDKLGDILDGFTSWGSKRFRILPQEPDL